MIHISPTFFLAGSNGTGTFMDISGISIGFEWDVNGFGWGRLILLVLNVGNGWEWDDYS
jgi:hypothetical protein